MDIIVHWKIVFSAGHRCDLVQPLTGNGAAMSNVDLEHVNKQFMAALAGIAEGKGLSDSVAPPSLGAPTVKIIDALHNAIKYLDEPFPADHLDYAHRVGTNLSLAFPQTCPFLLSSSTRLYRRLQLGAKKCLRYRRLYRGGCSIGSMREVVWRAPRKPGRMLAGNGVSAS